MIFLDTETVGFHGQPVLIQYAVDDGPIVLHSIWTSPIHETLSLIESFTKESVVGFNLAFDWFHLCKIYTLLRLYPDGTAFPDEIIDELAELELEARDGPCLKPAKAFDVFLHAKKTHYQSLMDRSPVRIKRVPTAIAWALANELEKRIKIKDIYFARRADKNKPRWSVLDIHDSEGHINPDFKDLVLQFQPSSGLKALAADALGYKADEVLLFADIDVDSAFLPKEYGYAPFAAANGGNRHNKWNGNWPAVIEHHISHWAYNEMARKYAEDDVKYTRELYQFFGSPEIDDDDSVLSCCVAACRWRGYTIDVNRLKELKIKALKKVGDTPTAPGPVQHYVLSLLSPAERVVIRTKFRTETHSTKKSILEEISKFVIPCPKCNNDAEISYNEVVTPMLDDDVPEVSLDVSISASGKECEHCSSTGTIKHPAAVKAKEVLEARSALKEIEIFDKLIMAGRLHASFKVIGSLSGRMSGDSDLNPQGIKKAKEVRRCFTLASEGYQLDAGDFSGFEVTLAEACYKDPNLRRDLLTCEVCNGSMERVNDPIRVEDFLQPKALELFRKKSDKAFFTNDFICKSCGSNKSKKIHALFGINVFPHLTYDQLKATDGTEKDLYTACKQAVFAMLYGGTGDTLADRLGVDIDVALAAYNRFVALYPQVGIERQKVINRFESMKQPNGIGTKVEWHEPADYEESMFGFRRYFTLENMICKTLFEMANNPPKSWKDIKIKVVRRDRVQQASGAAQSALYAAAFAIQAGNTRAAMNHTIQSSGAQITKKTQRAIWDIQPAGINPWIVQPMNIHDEIQCVVRPEYSEKVADTVKTVVESFRSAVPLIRMDWGQKLESWADKS